MPACGLAVVAKERIRPLLECCSCASMCHPLCLRVCEQSPLQPSPKPFSLREKLPVVLLAFCCVPPPPWVSVSWEKF